MTIQLERVTYVIVYDLHFAIDDRRGKSWGLFGSKEDAERCAKLPLGWYGGSGHVYSKEIKESEVGNVVFFESAEQFAKANLTINQYEKYFE